MTVNRLPVHFMALSLLLIGGCLVLPVGQRYIPSEIRASDLEFIKLGVTTKSEVVERVGEGRFWEEHNVIAYHWASETDLLYIIGTMGGGTAGGYTYRQNYAVYIPFDSSNHVKRFQRMQVPDKGLSVKEWIDRE